MDYLRDKFADPATSRHGIVKRTEIALLFPKPSFKIQTGKINVLLSYYLSNNFMIKMKIINPVEKASVPNVATHTLI